MKKNENFVNNSLTIYVAKENLSDENIIKDFNRYIKTSIDNDDDNNDNESILFKKIIFNNHTIYIKKYFTTSKAFFQNYYKDDLNMGYDRNVNYSIADIYNIEIKGNNIKFIVTFGKSSLINNDCFEERFGLKTILGMNGSLGFREVSYTDISKECKTVTQKLTRARGIKDFEISYNTNIVKNITINQNYKGINSLMKGSDSVNIKTKHDIRNIENLLKELYDIYSKETYKKNYEWIDYIKDVKNKHLISNLDLKLVEMINQNDKNVWMAFPEDSDQIWIQNVSYLNERNKINSNDISLNEYKKYAKEISIDSLKKNKIFIIDDDDNVIKSFPALTCIYAELKFEEKVYVIENKRWYLIDNDFQKEVEDFYQKIKIWNVNLPNYNHKNEGEYNETVSNNNEKLLCLDKKLISYSKQNKYEICDILSTNKEFIHVKKYGSSAQMSHLFSQGLRSSESINDIKYLSDINKKIDEYAGNNFELFKINKKEEITVVFAIISKKESEKPNMPFFAKTSLRLVGTQLERYNIEFKIKNIFDQTNKNN